MKRVITKYRLRQVIEDYVLLPIMILGPFVLLIGAWLAFGYDTGWIRWMILALLGIGLRGRR